MADTELSVDQAIEGLLGGQAQPETAAESQAEAELSDAEAESSEATGEEVEASEGESQEEVEETEEDSEETLYKVKVNGKVEHVPLHVLVQRYQLQGALDKGFSDLKKQKETATQEQTRAKQEAEQAAVARQRYIEVVERTLERLNGIDEVSDPPEELRQTDPLRYQDMKIQAIEHRDRVRQLNEERNRAYQEQFAESQQQFSERLASERDKLLDAVPEWRDQSVYDREALEVRNYAVSQGWSQQEADSAVDHRAIVGLRKAMMYDRLMKEGTPSIEKKVKAAAPSIKSGRTVKAKSKDATQKAFDSFAKAASGGGMDAIDRAADYLVQRADARRNQG